MIASWVCSCFSERESISVYYSTLYCTCDHDYVCVKLYHCFSIKCASHLKFCYIFMYKCICTLHRISLIPFSFVVEKLEEKLEQMKKDQKELQDRNREVKYSTLSLSPLRKSCVKTTCTCMYMYVHVCHTIFHCLVATDYNNECVMQFTVHV